MYENNDQSEEPKEDKNNEEVDTPDEDLSIDAIKTLSNYMALNNVSSTIHFEKLEKKYRMMFKRTKFKLRLQIF